MVDMADAATPQPVVADQDEKFFAALGYFGFLFVVPLVVKPKSDYCKFHARQSMIMFLMTILVLVFLAALPWFGSLLTMGVFALYVLAIYRAYSGDRWNVPVIGGLAAQLNLDMLYGKAGLAMTGIAGLKDKAETLANKAGEAAKNLGAQEEKKPEAPVPTEQTPPPAAAAK